MSTSDSQAGTGSAVITVKPSRSAKLRAWHEESLRLLEKRKRDQEQQAELEAKYRASLSEEEKLPEKKEFDLTRFMAQKAKERRLREIVSNITGR